MAVTLAQAKLNVQDALQLGVIDEFRKSSYLLDNLTFDDAVSPTGGGATLTYGYTRLITQPTAQFRAVNEEYSKSTVEKQRYTVDLKLFGGAFDIDRVITNMGGIENELDLQMGQKIKAAKCLFHDTVINGDTTQNAKAFDGLDVAVTGTNTEWNAAGTVDLDLSTVSKIQTNSGEFLLYLNRQLRKLDGKPTCIMGNSQLISALEYMAQYTGRYQQSQDEWGTLVSTYQGIPLIDLGEKGGSADPVIGIDNNGYTSMYLVRFGLDGFHGISMAGQPPIKIWLPDFTTAGAVKTGEVEMMAAVALKATKAAGVIRKIKVA
jgi:hypothetical protein